MQICGGKLKVTPAKLKKFDAVLNVSIWQSPNSRRPFDTYKCGLMALIREAQMYGYKCRIFTDDSIQDKKFMYGPNVELVEYSFPQFRATAGGSVARARGGGPHRGTFGSLMRFLPMFDFYDDPLPQATVDVDFYCTMNFLRDCFAHLRRCDADYFLHFVDCQEAVERQRGYATPFFYANMAYTFRLPRRIFEGFLAAVPDPSFAYGIDEQFLNAIVAPHIFARRCIGIVQFWNVMVLHYEIYKSRDEKLKELIARALDINYGPRRDAATNFQAVEEYMYMNSQSMFVTDFREACLEYYRILAANPSLHTAAAAVKKRISAIAGLQLQATDLVGVEGDHLVRLKAARSVLH